VEAREGPAEGPVVEGELAEVLGDVGVRVGQVSIGLRHVDEEGRLDGTVLAHHGMQRREHSRAWSKL
jgi:hypothetical protein